MTKLQQIEIERGDTMTTVFTSHGVGKAPSMFNSNQGTTTGKWALAPDSPDRCQCWDPQTMISNVAEGYYSETWKHSQTHKMVTCRYGVCRRCALEESKGRKITWYKAKVVCAAGWFDPSFYIPCSRCRPTAWGCTQPWVNQVEGFARWIAQEVKREDD